MREVLISPLNSEISRPVLSVHINNSNLREQITNSRNFISIELCSNRGFNVDDLAIINPLFCSLTFLNKQSVEENLDLGKKLLSSGHYVVQHLAGRSLTKFKCAEILDLFETNEMGNILALRGDESRYIDDKVELPYAQNLVEFVRTRNRGGCIFVAGYPDKHPLSKTYKQDTLYLKEKVSRGADFIITQAVFSYDSLEVFSKNCKKFGVTIPIIVGLFIINSYRNLINMIRICSLQVPDDLMNIITKNKDNDDVIKEFGIFIATDLIKKAFNGGFKGVHIFTLNNLGLVRELKARLGFCSKIERPLEVLNKN